MIYTLSSQGSFCDILAERWLDENKDNLWGLSKITVYVPTNRAAKTLKEAFLRKTGGKTLLLPKIISLANLDAFDELISEPISELERRLILSKLICCKQPMGEDRAFALAETLSSLIDEMHHYDISIDELNKIVPENFASHWQETLSFLEIIKTFWPKILEEKGKIDPALYQIKQVKALINSWKKRIPQTPIYAVGFTGGLPIIEAFLKAVFELPTGQIFIPNLDKNLSDDIWNNLDETHPQFYLKKLLTFLNIERKDVICLGETQGTFDLLSYAMLPASKTQLWQNKLNVKNDNTIRLIECENSQNEAFEIACLLREVLETPEKTAALVTTDRQLARRVKIQMQKWNILLDDSAGTPLSSTPVGTFLIQLANAAVSRKKVDLLCVLKHPLCLDGQDYTAFRKKVHQAEKKARKEAQDFNFDLNTDLSRFMNLFVNPICLPFEELLKMHLSVAQDLCASADKSGTERLWESQAGQEASDLLSSVLANASVIGDIEPTVYADFFKMILRTVNVRPKYGMHPRLDILGPIEARLQQPDVIIIGGMNEGTFPQMPSADNWINRPMRQICGLPLPEEKIGVAAQDFIHLLQAKEVILTRAIKIDGAQTIPSRWLIRLQTVLEKSGQKLPSFREGFSICSSKVPSKISSGRPSPTPPIVYRPDRLSISDICTFLRDPYSIYAKHILKILKLNDLQDEPDSSCFGNAVHNTLATFLSLSASEQTLDKLLMLGKQFLKQQGFNSENSAFVEPKFEKIAHWFFNEYKNSFPKALQYLVEQTAIMQINLKNKIFYLKGRADRIDVFDDGTATVIDYKAKSSIPKDADVLNGTDLQLPLEALMLKEGFFPCQEKEPKALTYWQLDGKNEGGSIKVIKMKEEMDIFLEHVKEKLLALLEKYENPKTSYPACPKPKYQPEYNDYAHLERLAEWQEEGDENGD